MTQSTLQRLKELTGQLEASEYNEALASTRLKTVLDAARAGIWDWEVSKDILRWDKRMVELFDYDPSSIPRDEEGWYLLKYEDFINRVHTDDKAKVQKKIEGCLYSNQPYRVTYRIVDRDLNEHLVIQAAGDIHNPNKGEERLVGVCISLEVGANSV
jgi:PAS domain-containing protein